MIKLRVPATSANLGIGFDCLGIAFQLYADFSFEKSNTFSIKGCDERYATKDNLVYTSLKTALAYLNKEIDEVSIIIESNIPLARGLGSSASCVVAGVVAAYYLSDTSLDKEEALSIATLIEGHPDNVTPAMFGCLQASFAMQDEVLHASYTVHPSFQFVALIPDYEVSTQKAREVLPKQLDFSLVVENASKLPLLLEALQKGQARHLQTLLEDKIHEPYRKKLLDEYADVKAICMQLGCVGFYLSGSGPTLIAIFLEDVAMDALNKKIKALNSNWKALLLAVDSAGVKKC